MRKPTEYIGTGDMALAAGVSARQLQRLVAVGGITPDAFHRKSGPAGYRVALFNPKRAESLRALVSKLFVVTECPNTAQKTPIQI